MKILDEEKAYSFCIYSVGVLIFVISFIMLIVFIIELTRYFK